MPEIFIIEDNAQEERKVRKVTIHKPDVYNDIDTITFKFMDAQGMPTPRQENAVSSDINESVDRKAIVASVDFYDACLRKRLQSFLWNEDEITEADDITDLDSYFYYKFSLPESYRDSTLKPLAVFIHRYLVYGALFDWYSRLGLRQASQYGNGLRELENDIVSNLRTPSSAKRPMQPFGPATKHTLPL